jgi:hypothetical protein
MNKPNLNLNLFYHAPKELATDAFIAWIFYFLDSDPKYSDYKKQFFNKLILQGNDQNKNVTEVKVCKQVPAGGGKIDLHLKFKLEGKDESVFFENKTWSTMSQDQLKKYMREDNIRNAYRRFYLKLSYINVFELEECGKYNFAPINAKDFHEALVHIKDCHSNIQQYAEYLEETFVKENEKAEKLERVELLATRIGQEVLLSKLYNKLIENNENTKQKLLLRTGSNSDGSPWTQLDLIEFNKDGYNKDGYTEKIFWRVDKQGGKPYIRLNQYQYKPKPSDWGKKKNRLSDLRKLAKEIAKEHSLEEGQLSNRGKAESTIIIFFPEDKDLPDLVSKLAAFTKEFLERYSA